MKSSVKKWIGGTGLTLVASVFLGGLVVDAALAGKPASSAPEAVQSVPPQQAIEAQSLTWAAKARLLNADRTVRAQNVGSSPSYEAQSRNWAAKGRLLNADGTVHEIGTSSSAGSDDLGWTAAGVGIVAILGLFLVACALTLRLAHVREKPVS
jgi:hypothetical protein